MSKKFHKNYHVAKSCSWSSVLKLIKNYPKQYSTPKYLLFIRDMIESGWEVKLHEVRVSKYVFISKGAVTFKIRFSNHKPILSKELEEDCDFYVGVSHKQVSTTQQIMEAVKEKENGEVTAFGYVLQQAMEKNGMGRSMVTLPIDGEHK